MFSCNDSLSERNLFNSFSNIFDDYNESLSHVSIPSLLAEAGFTDIELVDRNAWYCGFARDQAERIQGPLRGQLIEVCGADQYEDILRVSRANAGAAACGRLRPTHVRAVKPRGS